ncbi:MAG: hypothetical protein SPF77_05940 [Gemmiger sp.]|uniref:hypothetical protein n=1 Tax=Gemmiger sp. TaxID=2049027 RepID=UPI002A909661|nr:hypothetical protein [Gemmiger sp.]MDY5502100.1 hypothetical protein [Gemmiger sp.]
MLISKCKPLDPGAGRRQGAAQKIYCAALVLLLILSEVFSSNIQSTLPTFSHLARLALTGGAVVLLGVKIFFLTDYEARWQPILAALVLAYTAFATWYGDDVWFFLAALVGLGAKDIDIKVALRVYLAAAVAGLLAVQLLHFVTPLMPYNFYCRNWDFGYGHYNGFGARLAGVAFAWGWLRHDRMRALDWMGLAALAIFTYKVPGSRGAFGGMAVMLGLFLVQKFFPKLFDNKIWYALVLAVPVGLAVFSLYAGYIYDPVWPYDHMAILLLSIFLSGRFEIWHNVFWGSPLTLLGGLPTDGDEHHAIDNTFLAVPMNKGLLGAALVAVFFLLLLWRLAKKHRSTEMICLLALTLYLFMENKPFLLSANPFLLLAPVVFFGSGEKTQEKE